MRADPEGIQSPPCMERWASVIVPATMVLEHDGPRDPGTLCVPLPGGHMYVAVRSGSVDGMLAALKALSGPCGTSSACAELFRRAAAKTGVKPGAFHRVFKKGTVSPRALAAKDAIGLRRLVRSGAEGVRVEEVLPPHPAAAPDRRTCSFGLYAAADLPMGTPVALYDAEAEVSFCDGRNSDDCAGEICNFSVAACLMPHASCLVPRASCLLRTCLLPPPTTYDTRSPEGLRPEPEARRGRHRHRRQPVARPRGHDQRRPRLRGRPVQLHLHPVPVRRRSIGGLRGLRGAAPRGGPDHHRRRAPRRAAAHGLWAPVLGGEARGLG